MTTTIPTNDVGTRLDEAAAALERIAEDAEAHFEALSAEQLDWRPDPKSWSIAQCLDHLVRIQVLYFPLLERLAKGEYRPSFWERYSPLSGLMGRALISALDPENRSKTKATASAEPDAGRLGDSILRRFKEHQSELARRVRAVPGGLDPRRVTVTSPLSSLMTYSLDDALTVLEVHGRRHLAQAQRVIEAESFPGG